MFFILSIFFVRFVIFFFLLFLNMYYSNKIIKIYFKKPIYRSINTLFMSVNKDLIYYDNNHINYIYKINEDNIEYIFNGFFKDNYFVITFSAFNKEYNIKLENDNIIIIKLEWILKKISENTSLWVINDLQFINYKSDCLILPINNILFSTNNINLEDYLKLYDNTRIELLINLVDTIDVKKKFSLKKIFQFITKHLKNIDF